MQRLGLLLIWLGAIVGGLVALALTANVVAPVALHGAAWWVAIGAVKLTLLGAGGLMATGAAVRRLGIRQRDRALPEASRDGP